MNASIFVILGFLLISIYWAIGASKGQQKSIEQWALGGRGMGTIITFFLLAGEFLTTFSLTGLVGLGYNSGVSAMYFMTYITLGCVVGFWLLPAIRRYGSKHNLISQSDFYAKKYDSPLLGRLVTLVGVVSMIPLMIISLKGLGILVSVASYGSISPTMAIWIGTIAVVIYTMLSGLHGSSRVALIKDVLTFGILVFLGIYLPYHYHGGIASMLQGVSAVKPQLLTLPGVGMSVTWFISTVVLSTVGFFMWPNAFLSTFSAKSDKALRRNSMMLPLYSLMQLFSIMVAFTAVLSIPGLKGAEGDLGLIKLALQTFDPWFVGLIGAAGLLGALVPCSVLLIAASSMLTKNVYTSFAPASSDLQLAKVAKGITLLLALVVLYFTLNAGSALITFYLMSYNFITQLAPALFFSLLKNNFITRQGAISGMVVGLLLAIYVGMTNMTTAALFPAMPSFIQDINIGLLILILNLVTMLIVSSITKPKDVAI